MTTGARTPEAVEADAPLGFILTAVLRLASFYPIRDYPICELQNRDLVICLRWLLLAGQSFGAQCC